MAKIYIYDATSLDEEQISAVLNETDHSWEYISDKICDDNVHADAEAISVFVSSTVTREQIEAMPNLRLIACRSTGFNNIDLEAAAEHDITVVNVPTYGEATVAEYAFALLLALTRRIPETLNKQVLDAKDVRGSDLHGKTLGVVGAGHIGRHTINIGKGFGMNVVAYDPYPNEELANQFGFSYVSLEELLKQADAISLHSPYNEQTHHIIGEAELKLMKKSCIIVNTARGELVDTSALIEALQEDRIGGAALDVIEGEVLLKHDEELALLRKHEIDDKLLLHGIEISTLKRMPNVLITPHNAYNTYEAVGRINQISAQNLIDFWYGHMPNKVDIDHLKTKKTGKLILVRHAESEWNATGQWTGITDVHLSEKGFHEAALLGLAFKNIGLSVDKAYCSEQIRTRETLEILLNAAQKFGTKIERTAAINERDYGVYTGKNKWEMKDILGEEEFNKIRRGWDVPIENGESLKDVYERSVPFYKQEILSQLQAGKNIMVVGHGNSIRSLMKYIDTVSDEDVSKLEMLFDQIVIYDVDEEGKSLNKQIEKIDLTPKNA